jgi:hypothetical protein
MNDPPTVTEVRQLFFTTTCVITITTVIINGGMTVPVLAFLQVSMTSVERLRLAEFMSEKYSRLKRSKKKTRKVIVFTFKILS